MSGSGSEVSDKVIGSASRILKTAIAFQTMILKFSRWTILLVLLSSLFACSKSQASFHERQPTNIAPKTSITTEDLKQAEEESYQKIFSGLQEVPTYVSPDTKADARKLLRHKELVIEMFAGCIRWATEENTWNPKKLTSKDREYLLQYLELLSERAKYTSIWRFSEKQLLVRVICGGGAYQNPSIVYLFTEISGQPKVLPLKLESVAKNSDTGQLIKRYPFKGNVFDGIAYYSPKTKELNILYKGRGIEDCGMMWSYTIRNNNFYLISLRAHYKCDGKATPES